MGTYVVGDIHGCYDAWMDLKNKIEEQDEKAVFILVGDIVDRGVQVMEMIDWAMENITEDGKYQMIYGNHELEKLEWFAEYSGLMYPEEDYTVYSPDNYNFQSTLEEHNVTHDRLKQIIAFFAGLPVYKELYIDTGKKRGKQHYVIVHAYLPPECINKDESVKKSSLTYSDNCTDLKKMTDVEEKCVEVVWKRNYYGYNRLKSTIVLHGHTPTLSTGLYAIRAEKGKICYQKNDINLDCGLVFGEPCSNLAAIRLEDLQEFYLYPENEESEAPYAVISREAQKRAREELLKLIHGQRNGNF